MKTFAFVCFVEALAGTVLFAQTTTPLHQYMNANSLIDRPPVFQNLQDNIEQLYANVPPGVRLDYFEDKITAAKKQLYQEIQAPQLEFTDTAKVGIENVPDFVSSANLTSIRFDRPSKTLCMVSISRDDSIFLRATFLSEDRVFSQLDNFKDVYKEFVKNAFLNPGVYKITLPDAPANIAALIASTTITYDPVGKNLSTPQITIGDTAKVNQQIKTWNGMESLYRQFTKAYEQLYTLSQQSPFIVLHFGNTADMTLPLAGVDSKNLLLTNMEKKLAANISAIFRNLKTKPQLKPEEKSAILSSIIVALKVSELAPDASVESDTSDYCDQLGKQIARLLMNEVREDIASNGTSNNVYEILSEPDKRKDEIVSFVSTFDSLSVKAREILFEDFERAMNQSEDKVKSVLNNSVKDVFGASAGLAVTRGQGTFDGGVFYSFSLGTGCKGGIYFNGAFNKADSVLPAEELFGGQLQFLVCGGQADFLFSYLQRTGGKDVTQRSTCEAGIGISRRFGEQVGGLELYGFQDGNGQMLYIGGFSIKGSTPNSPSILIGFSDSDNVWRPIMQVGFPITAN